MAKWSPVVLSILGFLSAGVPAQVDDQDYRNPVFQRVKQSIAYVRGQNGSGTGFMIRRGILATNSHVIGGEYIENLRVQFLSAERPDSKELKVKLLYEDRNRDIALLALDSPEESPPPLVLAEIRELSKGRLIVVIGNPIKLSRMTQDVNRDLALKPQEVNRVSEGVVDSLVVIDKKTWYHLKADTAPGNSGGPVLDARTGQVLGVLTLGVQDPLPDGDPFELALRQARLRNRREIVVIPQPRNAFCIPCQFLREALRKIEDPNEPKKSPKELAARHLAEMVVWNVDTLHTECQELAKKQLEFLRTGRRGLIIELNRNVAEWSDKRMKPLVPAIRAVRSNPALSSAVRQGVQNLLDNYQQVKKQTEWTTARNELNYRKLLYKLSQNHASYLRQLSEELVVPDKE